MVQLSRRNEAPRPGPEMEVIRVKNKTPREFVLLSHEMWGTDTHWDGKRTMPCYEPHEECIGHQKGYPRRWKGYLHVWDVERRREAFLEVTPVINERLKQHFPPGESFRKFRIKLQRSSDSEKGRLIMEMKDRLQVPWPGMPVPKSPLKTLLVLWEVPEPLAQALLAADDFGLFEKWDLDGRPIAHIQQPCGVELDHVQPERAPAGPPTPATL